MLGLGYESSDDDEVVAPPPTKALSNGPDIAAQTRNTKLTSFSESNPTHLTQAPSLEAHKPANTANGPSQGPSEGPSEGPSATPPPGPAGPPQDGTHQSPYYFTRMEVQRLTMPTAPNFDIPHTPPGSPPQASTKKFKTFLGLKKKGQHFNQRLEKSTVLRDPAHLQRLMDFAGISEEDSYASTLSDDVAVPTTFPGWAYVEELSQSYKKMKRKKEEEKAKAPRTKVDFVPATGSGGSSTRGTPSDRKPSQSMAEKVKEGMDKDQGRVSSQDRGKRKELEHRDKRSKFRSRSRSPKRRRSRSTERDRRR
ncbi:hypothetical protein P154DRAFT_622016 [Amniculicola lignicola CBS 123094]|uniref:HCNGP-domain-containing protein n=1 Tax=Amniculicola lignicola CBS 123094 TaxID=1392246 RepID=A0A6A5WD13_9PLEO|nr:hypothetical protein P154DRAFT_622016 [Amniculicola lignicola CBS 123094]